MKRLALLILTFFPLVLLGQQKDFLMNGDDYSEKPNLNSLSFGDLKLSYKTLIVKEEGSVFTQIPESRKKETVMSNKEVPEIMFALSSGLYTMTSKDNVFYSSLDINLNLAFIYKNFYLSAGGFMFPGYDVPALQITPCLGYNIFNDKIFTSVGGGVFLIIPGVPSFNLALRVNYNITKFFSLGLDSRYVTSNSNGDINAAFLFGLNIALKVRG
jgi:hypothetical protein